MEGTDSLRSGKHKNTATLSVSAVPFVPIHFPQNSTPVSVATFNPPWSQYPRGFSTSVSNTEPNSSYSAREVAMISAEMHPPPMNMMPPPMSMCGHDMSMIHTPEQYPGIEWCPMGYAMMPPPFTAFPYSPMSPPPQSRPPLPPYPHPAMSTPFSTFATQPHPYTYPHPAMMPSFAAEGNLSFAQGPGPDWRNKSWNDRRRRRVDYKDYRSTASVRGSSSTPVSRSTADVVVRAGSSNCEAKIAAKTAQSTSLIPIAPSTGGKEIQSQQETKAVEINNNTTPALTDGNIPSVSDMDQELVVKEGFQGHQHKDDDEKKPGMNDSMVILSSQSQSSTQSPKSEQNHENTDTIKETTMDSQMLTKKLLANGGDIRALMLINQPLSTMQAQTADTGKEGAGQKVVSNDEYEEEGEEENEQFVRPPRLRFALSKEAASDGFPSAIALSRCWHPDHMQDQPGDVTNLSIRAAFDTKFDEYYVFRHWRPSQGMPPIHDVRLRWRTVMLMIAGHLDSKMPLTRIVCLTLDPLPAAVVRLANFSSNLPHLDLLFPSLLGRPSALFFCHHPIFVCVSLSCFCRFLSRQNFGNFTEVPPPSSVVTSKATQI